MVKEDIKDVKKMLKLEQGAIETLCVCYVNGDRNIISLRRIPMKAMPQAEAEQYTSLLKKALSGKMDSNLLDLDFPLEAEEEGGRQKVLMKLLRCKLEDDDTVEGFFRTIIEEYDIAGNCMIVLACGVYDIPAPKTVDDKESSEESEYVYSFLMCCICPVEPTKPCLCYSNETNAFTSRDQEWMAQMPETAFLFPAYKDRGPDVHSCLYYIKNPAEQHASFAAAVLGCSMPMGAKVQKDTFCEIIQETLEEDASVENIVAINQQLAVMAQAMEDDGERIAFDADALQTSLNNSGIDRKIDPASINEEVVMAAGNIVEPKYTFKGDGVRVVVDASAIDMLEQRVIDGRPCLIVPISDMTLNGIGIRTRMDEE